MSFWQSWKDLDEYEISGISDLKKFISDLTRAYGGKIWCIFCHGSFVRRERNKKSDIDVKIVVKDVNVLEEIKLFAKSHGNIRISAKCVSLDSLRSGSPDPGADMSPQTFITLAKEYCLVWGNPLDYGMLKQERDAFTMATNMMKTFLKSPPTKTVEFAKMYLMCIYWELRHRSVYTGEFGFKAIGRLFSPKDLPGQAIQVYDSSGEMVPALFREHVIEDVALRLRALTA